MNWTLPKAFKPARRCFGVVAILVLLRATNACAQNWQVFFDPAGNFLVEMAETSAPPQIIGQPQMQVVQPGATATFSVVALDASGVSYQWLFSGTNLLGQTSDALQVTNVSTNNQGYYSVVLNNSSGSVTSSPAPLWIDSRGCGMPDWWQLYYFGNLTNLATGDFDGDGVSNLQEFLDGTNPTNAASARFRLSIINLGSVVAATPNLLSYSNGDTVSLSATAIPPYTFRAWGGDASGTNNPVTLTMTNNKTVIAYAGAFTITWTNGSNGDWNAASNWYPSLVPDPSDNVLITSSVTVSSSNSIECAGLTLGAPGIGPTLAISGNLTLDGPSYWIAGTMSGSGSTIVGPAATLTFDNPSTTIYLSGRTLENDGTILWAGASDISLTSAIISNAPASVFIAQNAANLNGSSSRFDNAGSFLKSGSQGTTTLNVPFNNVGSVDVQSGTLLCGYPFTNSGMVSIEPGATNNISDGGSATGSFIAQPGSVAEWTGNSLTPPFTLMPGAQLNGSGVYRLDGSTVNFNTDLGVQNLNLVSTGGGNSPTLSGSGNLTISNLMNWTQGTMSGSGLTIIAAGATLNIAANPYTLNLSRSLENAGTVFWTGIGINVNGAVLTNCPGALFNAQNAASLNGSSARFDNAGTFRKNVSQGTTTLTGLNFNNYGLVDLQTGTLQCTGSFTNSGSVNLAPGTTNLISGGGLATGSFSAPATALVDWTGNAFTAAFTLSSGVQLNGAGVYRLDGSTVNFNTDLGVQNLDLVNIVGGNPPTLAGSGNLTISNVMNWTQGTMSGTGTIIIAPGATLNAAANPYTLTLSRSLQNAGTVLWTGVGINLNSAVLTNWPGALFNAQNSASLSASSSRFDNAGTFRKNVSPGTTTLTGLNFNNYGLVDLQTGTLQCTGSFTNSGSVNLAPGTTNLISGGGLATGSFSAPATALVDWTGNAFTAAFTLSSGVQLNGAGVYRLDGSTVNFNTDLGVQNLDLVNILGGNPPTLAGSGNLTISNVMNWTQGTMSGSGLTIIAPGATLNIAANPYTLNLSRSLENAGTVFWTGIGINLNSAVLTNCPGALFNAQNAASLNGSSARFDNAGTFRKSINPGTTTFTGLGLSNYATVDLQTGVLALNSGFSSLPTALLNCGLGGTNAGSNYGQLQVSGTLTLNGGLSVNLEPGYLPATNDSFTVVTGGSRTNSFASFSYPSNRVAMVLSNSPSSVILSVTGVLPIPQPVLLTPQILGSNALLTWTATSNVTYRLENKSALSFTNWSAVPGDVTTLSNLASKLDPLTPTNRFYRVRLLP